MYSELLRSTARNDGLSRDVIMREVVTSVRYARDADVRQPYDREEVSRAADSDRLDADARVRAIVDVPEYEVNRGEVGVVCSTWNLPWRLIEVEFTCVLTGEIKRALLNPDQIERHDDASDSSSSPGHAPELPDACDETEDELQPA